jgi:hypothetical protein
LIGSEIPKRNEGWLTTTLGRNFRGTCERDFGGTDPVAGSQVALSNHHSPNLITVKAEKDARKKEIQSPEFPLRSLRPLRYTVWLNADG